MALYMNNMTRDAPLYPNRIRQWRMAHNMSQGRLAALVATSQPQIDRLEKGERRLTMDWVTRIAAALSVSPAALLDDAPAPPQNFAQSPVINQPVLPIPMLPATAPMPRDIPVMGTAQGGTEGVFHLNTTGGGPIDWARRPPGLVGMTSIFAIYVEGDSMVPWRQPGELLFVQDGRTPAPGNHVIVITQDHEPEAPARARVKKLLRRTAQTVELEQYNPPGIITIPSANIVSLYRVLEWSEVLGL